MSSTPEHHPSFRSINEQYVQSLNVSVQEFEHIETGASHIHLSSSSNENVFLVALRTVPHDSTGVAHILEHTALCGSKKYPVRDPFFMMTRRSLNTFMNAFTSSDWTAYPFASMNKKDFHNLLDVYLDAVFFSRLDALDFAQEGHRLEFSEIDNPQSELQYKGVVFNEMKGAMSSVNSQLWHTLCRYLFPTSTYHYNSGGDPEAIPDLTYEDLVDFYKTHYHPSNAIFMTFGDIPAVELQTKFQEQALNQFSKMNHVISVSDEKRYHAPLRVQEFYANNDADTSQKTHVVLGWLLGQSTNLEESLRAQLLASVLLDNSAAPLMHLLETTDLGLAPSPLCGLDDSQKELSFMCGLSGCKAEVADEVESIILETLERLAEEGVPQSEVESALHQLELHQREIGGDHYPYGLQMILTALTNATHRGDPVKLLNIDPVLEKLREEIKSPDFIKQLVKKYLLENDHRVRLVLSPDSDLNQKKEAAERALLDKIQNNLSDAEKEQIVSQSVALNKRQDANDDADILPKVTLADVPKTESYVSGTINKSSNVHLTQYSTGTNGLVYQQIIYPLPEIEPELLQHLSLYSNVVTELGHKDKSYIEVQKLQASVCGSFSGFSSLRSNINDKHQLNANYCFSGKALNSRQKNLTQLMFDSIEHARFDEHSRIKELVEQINTHNEQRITGQGHGLAMSAATSGISGLARYFHNTNGLAGFKKFKALNQSLTEKACIAELADKLAGIHTLITQGEKQLLVIGEQEWLDGFSDSLSIFNNQSAEVQAGLQLDRKDHSIKEAWLTNSQVNFCAKSYETVTMNHPDAAPLSILGGLLRNGFLHTAIREKGGAYGGGAMQDSNIGAFKFYSYRDPRLEETLNDFDQSISWLKSTNHSSQKLEEAILGVVSSLDSSESPAGKAKRCFHAELNGRSVEIRQQFRERILKTQLDDLVRVAETYLVPERQNIAIVTDISQSKRAEALGLAVNEF